MITIPITRSVKQGSVESCLFFNVVMAEVLNLVDAEHNLGFRRDNVASVVVSYLNRAIY